MLNRARDLMNGEAVKSRPVVADGSWKHELGKTRNLNVISSLQELGVLRFKRLSFSGSDLPDWFRVAKPHETHFEISIPEHLVGGNWVPLGGGIPSSYASDRMKTGIALIFVWTESETGLPRLISGIEQL